MDMEKKYLKWKCARNTCLHVDWLSNFRDNSGNLKCPKCGCENDIFPKNDGGWPIQNETRPGIKFDDDELYE